MPGARLVVAGSLVACCCLAAAASAATDARWQPLAKVPGIVDVAGPRSDGQLVLSARSGLYLLRPGGAPAPFAEGAYRASGGEPYVALAEQRRLAGKRCSWHRDDAYAIDGDSSPGIVRVVRAGKAVRFLDLPKGSFPSGIAFDTVGRFGYRLLVTVNVGEGGKTTLYAVDCLGQAETIARDAEHVEGGIVVAPRSFGAFGGDLIAADEVRGRILAFGPGGTVRTVAKPGGLGAGADLGVESLGFVPPGPSAGGAAYLADLGAKGSPTEGGDSLLVLRGDDLKQAALRPGELVAATEAGGVTVAVRCARRCSVRRVGAALPSTHAEGHVTFVPVR